MWELKNLMKSITENSVEVNGKWIPARPINYQHRTFTEKLREAYAVFIGKADCFKWPEGQ